MEEVTKADKANDMKAVGDGYTDGSTPGNEPEQQNPFPLPRANVRNGRPYDDPAGHLRQGKNGKVALLVTVIVAIALFCRPLTEQRAVREQRYRGPSSWYARPEWPNEDFDDLVGYYEHKEKIIRLGSQLQLPKDQGLASPLFSLQGPKGTGKRLFSKASASHLNATYLELQLEELVACGDDWAAEMIAETFTEAKAALSTQDKRPLVLFVDLGYFSQQRRQDLNFRAATHHNKNNVWRGEDHSSDDQFAGVQYLSQILKEVDLLERLNYEVPIVTFVSSKSTLVPLAALAKRAFDKSGRPVVRMEFRFPTTAERKEIIEKKVGSARGNGEDLCQMAKYVADQTHGLNGLHLSNIVKLAIVKAGDEPLNGTHMKEAIKEIAEEEDEDEETHRLEPWERLVVAFHEAGHVVSAWQSTEIEDVKEVSILPGEDGALGCTKYASSGKLLHTNDMLLTKMAVAVAGHLAEIEFFGDTTTGSRDDLYKMTKIAYMKVANFGMDQGLKASFGGQSALVRSYGGSLADQIDQRVLKILDSVEKRSAELVKRHAQTIEKVALSLLEHDLLKKSDIEALIGPRPIGKCGGWPCHIYTSAVVRQRRQLPEIGIDSMHQLIEQRQPPVTIAV